jgi:putative ABC transport system permease protein
MHRRTLILRSLVFHWRSHLAVALGAMVCGMVLSGALLVGDSVRFTLQKHAENRLGKTALALAGNDRFFREALAEQLEDTLGTETVPLLQLRGSVARGDGGARANGAQVLGVDSRFWALGEGSFGHNGNEGIILNHRLAHHLGVGPGDEVLLRIEKPSLLPLDAPLSTEEETTISLRIQVQGIAPEEAMGSFSLQPSQVPPYNAFLPLQLLQKRIDRAGKANLMLATARSTSPLPAETANQRLHEEWTLEDAGLELREVSGRGMVELRTGRIFLDPAAADAALKAATPAHRALTYFVNEIRHGDRFTPYSIVGSLESLPVQQGEGPERPPSPLKSDEILLNQWTASDLGAKAGDIVEVRYYILGPLRNLEEVTRKFTVRAVVPIEGPWRDPDLMPDFPGMTGKADCRDWDPGFAINLDRIRDKDEEYWDAYRGTPKAFVSLESAQAMWTNRFGNLTAIRFPLLEGSAPRIAESILAELPPRGIGLTFVPVRERAAAAHSQALDFGQLFLGFSFFLILSGLLLVGLLNAFSVEKRSEEAGILRSAGYPAKAVQRIFLMEGILLALAGSAAGVFLGVAYTKLVLWGLATVWAEAVGGGIDLYFHCRISSLLTGLVLSVGMASVSIWLTVRHQASRPARVLLMHGGEWAPETTTPKRYRRTGFVFGAVGLATGLGLMCLTDISNPNQAAGVFFGAGAALLVSGLGFFFEFLSLHKRRPGELPTARMFRWGNAARRPGRSGTTAALLACGTFLIIAVGANRHDASLEAGKRSSGTGGFALYAEATFPILHDLNTEQGCNAYGLSKKEDLQGVGVVPLRVHEGEDASCLNLNRPQIPTLLGVRPKDLAERGAFTLAEVWKGPEDSNPWTVLDSQEEDGTIPAFADQATIHWALGKSVGDCLAYVDERGQRFQIRLAGALANSIFQGNLLISEEHFTQRYPSTSGCRRLLIDTPADRAGNAAATLANALVDMGLDLTPAATRLAAFNAVENTYLSIFQALGGLGLIFGSAGLGVVVLRNILERRGELALLRALGFPQQLVQRFVLIEHGLLVLAGLAIGTLAGLAAVLPHLLSSPSVFPYLSLTATLIGIAGSGVFFTWAAVRTALKAPLLDALRND